MPWLNSHKRKNAETNRAEPYWSIGWRDATGKTRTRALGFLPPAEARRALKIFEGDLAVGRVDEHVTSAPTSSAVPPTATSRRPAIPTLADYLDTVYLPVVRRDRALKTYETTANAAKALKSLLGHLSLDAVSYAAADAYISARKRLGRKSRTIIIELRTLSMALRHAHDCGVLPTMPRLPALKDRDRQPSRYLGPAESVAVLDALRPLDESPHVVTRGKPPVLRDRLSYLAVLMALNFGLRRNEILSRGWEDVRWGDGPLGLLIIGAKPAANFRVKTGRERAIPLTPEVRTEMLALHRELGRPARGWIFPSPRDPEVPRKSFHTALQQACRRAGVAPVHPHGLRHTWASRLAVAGVDRQTLIELGGWRDGRMLDEVYAHVSSVHKAEVMARSGLGPTLGPVGQKFEMLDSAARQTPVSTPELKAPIRPKC